MLWNPLSGQLPPDKELASKGPEAGQGARPEVDFLHNQSRAGHYYIGGGDRCAQVVQIFLQVVLDEHCQCVNQPGLQCHHAYAQHCWFQRLSDAEPTPALLKGLAQYFLKVSKDLDEDSYVFQHIQTCLSAIVSVITWLYRFLVS